MRIPNWWRRNVIVAVFFLAGLYAATDHVPIFVVLWGVVALSERYLRLHGVDRIDPSVARRYRKLFLLNLADSARLYFMPIGVVLAFYFSLAALLTVVPDALTVQQLVAMQHAFAVVADFYAKWIKVNELQMLLVLLTVYLLSCMLFTYRTYRTVTRAEGRLRHRLAAILNQGVAQYMRLSGPVAAALTVLASFTFLSSTSGGLAKHLHAVPDTRDYLYAAEQVEAELTTEVVSQLYNRIHDAMPSTYPSSPATAFSAQVERTSSEVVRLKVPLEETYPEASLQLTIAAEQVRAVKALPARSVIAGPRGEDRIALPADLSVREAADAKRWYARFHDSKTQIAIIDDAGKQVVLQMEKLASEPAWNGLKEIVTGRFPLATPIVDALAEACDAQLQVMLRDKIPTLLRNLSDRSSDARNSINSTAKEIVSKVDIASLVSNRFDAAERLAAEHQTALTGLQQLERHAQVRADLVAGLIDYGEDGFQRSVPSLLGSDAQTQRDVISDLRQVMHEPQDTASRRFAGRAIKGLRKSLPSIITSDDLEFADKVCRCGEPS